MRLERIPDHDRLARVKLTQAWRERRVYELLAFSQSSYRAHQLFQLPVLWWRLAKMYRLCGSFSFRESRTRFVSRSLDLVEKVPYSVRREAARDSYRVFLNQAD